MTKPYSGPNLDAVASYQGASGSFRNLQDGHFKLFPFTTHKITPTVSAGSFLRRASGLTVVNGRPEEGLADEIMESFFPDLEDPCRREVRRVFEEVSTSLGKTGTSNLRFALSTDSDTQTEKDAWYLVSMVSDADMLRRAVRNALDAEDGSASLVERIVHEAIGVPDIDERSETETRQYYRVNRALSEVFLSDVSYVLSDPRLANRYLEETLDFYFFMTIAQNCMTVSRRTKGLRDELHKVYFALDWEKTSQNRRCYRSGFQTFLEPAVEEMFVHAGVLEILNTRGEEADGEQLDYIAIKEQIDSGLADAAEVASGIRSAANLCKNLCDEEGVFRDVPTPDTGPADPEQEIEYLYRVVKAILFGTTRDKARATYSGCFRQFCRGSNTLFEKSRGRNGTMLNVTEDLLLLLTVLSIGENGPISLTELFRRFEKRGVFFDEASKDEVSKFFEKRNMLDKKSDSGETQYVNRVL